ncbi:uncharacterized protein IL334_006186 [Kwoniella shivajii]|uniref:Uncharacterized protein n=1 Tax=Kwoniella shivajii TaxID=564305 RepID=A0ABZ1D590_9TREE|nr:hypothetical protein IL334_006186 [Kwoniella shivajii]
MPLFADDENDTATSQARNDEATTTKPSDKPSSTKSSDKPTDTPKSEEKEDVDGEKEEPTRKATSASTPTSTTKDDADDDDDDNEATTTLKKQVETSTSSMHTLSRIDSASDATGTGAIDTVKKCYNKGTSSDECESGYEKNRGVIWAGVAVGLLILLLLFRHLYKKWKTKGAIESAALGGKVLPR